jgi:hemolysin activation/secretion protein
VQNRNQIGRPEFFALGLQARVQLGRALSNLGSTRQPWLYEATVSRGLETVPEHSLFVSARLSGQYEDGKVLRQQAGASAQYYLPHHRRWLFYASIAGDTLTNPDANQSLLIGGDSDLRGYPLRYQAGNRRAVLTLEERFHTDYFPFRLFRLGGAAFVDYGRAWGGANVNLENPGWLADVGFGLRIFSVRAAFSNVLHVDLAFPLDADANIKKVQFNVKTKASF